MAIKGVVLALVAALVVVTGSVKAAYDDEGYGYQGKQGGQQYQGSKYKSPKMHAGCDCDGCVSQQKYQPKQGGYYPGKQGGFYPGKQFGPKQYSPKQGVQQQGYSK